MPLERVLGKGGRNAAFFFFLFLVAVLGYGGSLQYPLAVLRLGAFAAAIVYLWKRRGEAVPALPYPLLVGGFVLSSIGHSFSSTYFWVSFQHALNIALAAVLLAWAVCLIRGDAGNTWNAVVFLVLAVAVVELGVGMAQRFVEGDPRPHGTFNNPNFFSEYLAAAAVLCLSRLLYTRGNRPFFRWEAAGAGVFLIAALSLSSSRGVLLALLPALGILLMFRFGLRKGGIALACLGIPALLVFGGRSIGRFFSPDIYNYGRWIIWKSAVRTFLDHPFGVGLGGHKYFWYATQSPVPDAFRRYGKFAHTAHSEYLEVLSGLGAAGFLVFLAVLFVPLFLAIRAWKTLPPFNRMVVASATSCLVLSGTHAVFDFNFHEFGIVFLDAAMLGALLACIPGAAAPIAVFPAWVRSVGMAACAVLLIAALATAVGVYQYEKGEKILRAGDHRGAERAFLRAVAWDPYRAPYPDALSAVSYRKYREESPPPANDRRIPPLFFETLQWEDRARELAPREYKYPFRLSALFLELYRLRREPVDAVMALRLVDNALEINPFGVELLWHKAEILSELGREKEVGTVLEASVAVEPNFCRGYARLAGLAAAKDPAAAARWSAMEKACRRKAAALPLEEYEKWLVESPEER